MGVGWIDRIYNNTDQTLWWRSQDSSHNGAVVAPNTNTRYNMDDGQWHEISPRTSYQADWCGIPWYWNGQHFKAISTGLPNNLQIVTSFMEDGQNYIRFDDGTTGRPVGRQGAPKIDFHVWLRFEPDGWYWDIKNTDGSTVELATFIYDQVKFWVPVALNVLASTAKAAGSGQHVQPA